MKFAYTIVYVTSVTDALNFYQKAFGFKTRFLHESNQYGELDTGVTTLAFATHDMGKMNLDDAYVKADRSAEPLGIELAFTTDDVPAAFARAISAGATALKEPAEKPWGQTVAYVRGIDGSLIELCSPIDTH